MDGLGFPWESPDRQCKHGGAFSTIREGVCFVCKATMKEAPEKYKDNHE
jgi:hypothetical protein